MQLYHPDLAASEILQENLTEWQFGDKTANELLYGH